MWGNPWKVGAPGRFWLPNWPVNDPTRLRPLTAAECVDLYRHHLASGSASAIPLPVQLTSEGVEMALRDLEAHRSRIVENLRRLRGRDLACWCSFDAPCHADVLLDLANGKD